MRTEPINCALMNNDLSVDNGTFDSLRLVDSNQHEVNVARRMLLMWKKLRFTTGLLTHFLLSDHKVTMMTATSTPQ